MAPWPGTATETPPRPSWFTPDIEAEAKRRMDEARAEVASGVASPAARGGRGQVAVRDSGALVQAAEPIDGARWLEVADGWMSRHVWMTGPARRTAVLYTAAQHFRLPGEISDRRLAWPRFGRVLFTASKPGSGKTTAMILMGYMSAPWFCGIDGNPTAPGLCASIKEEQPILFIDEAHRLVGARGTRKADVVTILNIGYEKNGKYLNAKGGKANRVPVYAAAVLAGKDSLITSAGEEIGDLLDRCVAIIRMSAPPDGMELDEITDDVEAEGEAIAGKLAAWASQEMADGDRFRQAFTAACDVARDAGLTGRAKDVWVPLLTTGWLADVRHAESMGQAGLDPAQEWKILTAACEAAAEFRLSRPVQQESEADPLAGLEAALEAEGRLTAWA